MSDIAERSGGERQVLDEAGGVRAMTGVMAVMLFLCVLAAAGGLGTAGAARLLDRQLAGRLTVQVVAGEPARRDAGAARVLAALRASPDVRRATAVDRAELTRLLRPWLGDDGADAELPVPALIDVDLADTGEGATMRTVTLTAVALVVLMGSATAAVVVLAARAGLETHRGTIEVMHMLGSTDLQIARLFQRRIALDAALGGGLGAAAALGLVALLGGQLRTLGSELLGGVALRPGEWILLALLPLGFVALATLAARWTVLRTLRRTL